MTLAFSWQLFEDGLDPMASTTSSSVRMKGLAPPAAARCGSKKPSFHTSPSSMTKTWKKYLQSSVRSSTSMPTSEQM